MPIRYPQNNKWDQNNQSDKFGSLAYSRCINLDKGGYIKLSPRSVSLLDNTEERDGVSDTSFSMPVAFGRTDLGTFFMPTWDSEFNLVINPTTKTVSEDVSSSNPALVDRSHGIWWQNRWHVSLSTTISYIASGSWTTSAISSLSASFRHYMAVFKNRNTIVVTNGNVLKQYDTSYAASIDLTIPSDFEMTGVAYNNKQIGIITRLGSNSSGQNQGAYFFVWDGSTTSADNGVEIGADFALAIAPYKSSFVILTNVGQLLYWNGGGFEELATFPFYTDNQRLGDFLNHLTYGTNMVVEGDIILINVGILLTSEGRKNSFPRVDNPSGVWCYDPAYGLYHRYAPSNSKSYLHTITSGNINISTNIFTTSAVIPPTGTICRLSSSGGVGGLTQGKDYYVIRLTATTFQLATTLALAYANTAIDITATGSGSSYFWMYDIIDYGILFTQRVGAMALLGHNDYVSEDIIFGGEYITRAVGTTQKTLCLTVPFLENVGYFVPSKIFSVGITDTHQKIYCRFKPLSENDKIIIKVKDKEYFNIPSSVPQSTPGNTYDGQAIWLTTIQFTTTADISEAYARYVLNDALDIEFLAGAGAGAVIDIESISLSGSTYTVTLKEAPPGTALNLESYFIIDNWRTVKTITATDDDNINGYTEAPVGGDSTKVMVKVVMRGYGVTIEDLDVVNKEKKPSA